MDFDTLATKWAETQQAFPKLLDMGVSIIAAVCIFFIGIIVARWMRKRLRKSKFGGARIDSTLRPVIASIVFYFILAFTLYAVLTKLGVPSMLCLPSLALRVWLSVSRLKIRLEI